MQHVAHCNTIAFTLEDMRRFAGEAWGDLGVNIVRKWRFFNIAYFDGKLRPVPLVITNTQPFGKRLAFCSYGGHGKTWSDHHPQRA